MPDKMAGNGQALLEFLEWAGSTGEINQATANAYRTSTTKVLEIGGTDDESGNDLDIKALDIENHLDRFTRLKAGEYATSSLNTYKTRFRNAVDMYRKWLDDPSSTTWKSDLRERSGTRKTRKKEAPAGGDQVVETPVSSTGVVNAPPPPSPELLEYPFPLREGGTAVLKLPRQLRSTDVERMTKFLESLAIDPPKELPAGEVDGQG